MASLPLIALLGFGTWYVDYTAKKKYSDAQKLDLVPIGLTAKDPKNIFLDMQILNATDSQYKINSLTANVYYKDKLLGTIYRKDPFLIAPSNNSIIKLQVKPNNAGAIASFVDLFLKKGDKIKQFKVLGSFNYLGLNFAIDKQINLNG